jgi:uncharacterized membrane protein YphA (DoxX/SURF4 family)
MRGFARALPRLILGAVFLAAGALKGVDPVEFARQVSSYGIVTGPAATLVAYALIPAELILGLVLVVGFRTRIAAGLVAALLVVFISATAYGWSQGKTEGCGCFGSLASRGPGEVILEDLVFLALGVAAILLARGEPRRAGWRLGVVLAGAVAAILLPFSAYALPLDPVVTSLRVGRDVSELPLRESPVPLETGDHLVALIDLDDPDAREIVSALDRLLEEERTPHPIAFYGGEVDEKTVFCFNYDPGFEVVAAPRLELKRLYRTLPRFFRVRDGKVTRIWEGTPPPPEELR